MRVLCAKRRLKLDLPSRLYKYESFSIQSLLNLKKQIIYFASPSGFNDPYDCALKTLLNEPEEQDINNFRQLYLSKNWPPQVKEKLMKSSNQDLRPILLGAARQASEQILDNFIKSRGVSCFSEVNDELLMWAHYADKYQGFCLEFATDNELFEKARKVKYVNTMPRLSMSEIYVDGNRDGLMNLFCTKSKSWKYEKEWRVIHSEAGTEYTYPSEALTGVYFGPNMPYEAIEIICLVLQGQNQNVKFWKGMRSNTTFKVDFEEVNYSSYIASKQHGAGT